MHSQNGSTDRDLQDHIIRYLADAEIRSLEPAGELLDAEQASRAQRFSRFLARRYYRDRLTRGFRYSAKPGHEIASIVDASKFDSILHTCVLGSFATAVKIGDLACSHLALLRDETWWHELLKYERAFFLQLATSEGTPSGDLPRRNGSAVLHRFSLPISELLDSLRSGTQVRDGLQGNATLIFSRTAHGKIYVAEVDEPTSKVFETADGTKSADEIAAICGFNREETARILTTLAEIGSIVLPSAQQDA